MQVLKPFMTARTNISMKGPQALLPPKAALALGMAVHELTTNALKYGALARPEGRVNVTWQVQRDAEPAMLDLEWVEQDGPPVTSPAKPGLGMTLIERGLKQDMAADVKIEFAETGLKLRVTAPLRNGVMRQSADD
jgi:two-component sensor histidine kinase